MRADLTLVDARVPFLCPLDLQRPLFVVSVMIRLKALIAGVGVPSHCEDVDVSVSDPRNLQAQPSYLRELYDTDSKYIAHAKGFGYTNLTDLLLPVLH